MTKKEMLTEMHSFSLECALFFILQKKERRKKKLATPSCVENELHVLAFVTSPHLFLLCNILGPFVEKKILLFFSFFVLSICVIFGVSVPVFHLCILKVLQNNDEE